MLDGVSHWNIGKMVTWFRHSKTYYLENRKEIITSACLCSSVCFQRSFCWNPIFLLRNYKIDISVNTTATIIPFLPSWNADMSKNFYSNVYKHWPLFYQWFWLIHNHLKAIQWQKACVILKRHKSRGNQMSSHVEFTVTCQLIISLKRQSLPSRFGRAMFELPFSIGTYHPLVKINIEIAEDYVVIRFICRISCAPSHALPSDPGPLLCRELGSK